MSKFYVGQRVRVIRCDLRPAFVGAETVITGRAEFVDQSWRGGDSWWGYPVALADGFLPPADYLEPILYDGNQTVEWSECLWQPEGVAA